MRWPIVLLILFAAPGFAPGQENSGWRYFNGAPVKGEIVRVAPEGVEVQSGNTGRVVPWSGFSTATRFRFDPHYRANLALAQRGLALNAWTNPAEGGYTANPIATPTDGASTAGSEIDPLNFTGFPTLTAQPRAGLAGIDLRKGDRAVTWGFRFGPGPSDAIYYVMEPAGDDGLPSTLWVWTDPGKRPEALKGSRRSDGDETTVSFRKQRFQSRMDDADVRFDLGLLSSTRDHNALSTTLDVELKKAGVVSSFTLVGTPPGILVGDGNVVARDLLASPSLKLGVEMQDGKPILTGAIRMGRLALIPRASMQKGVTVVIRDGRSTAVIDELVPVKADSAHSQATVNLPLERLTAGQKYALRATVDLGPLLGSLAYEESFVRP